jgi:N-acetylglucosaminyldiphosphoundecaprenol N-acetyl-beta-D-mannosaminyltransferase
MTTVEVIGVPISCAGLDAAVETVDDWISERRRGYACLVNVHLIETAQRSPHLSAALRHADLSLPDGAPVAWLAGHLRRRPVQRVTGCDLFEALCSRRKRRHFFLGSTPETLERLTQAVVTNHPEAHVCGIYAPPFGPLEEHECEEMVARANGAMADIVWVGLGAPKQELWLHANRSRLTAPAVIGVGAVFDFASGTKPRAPMWMQRTGLEWAHRLVTEPRRLWRRYLVTNTSFALHAAGAVIRP